LGITLSAGVYLQAEAVRPAPHEASRLPLCRNIEIRKGLKALL
jgi:hypothetical protein